MSEICGKERQGIVLYKCQREKGHKGVHRFVWSEGEKVYDTWWE